MVLVADAPITRKLESRFFRFSDLQAMGIVGNWPTLLRWIAKGDFPPGVYLGKNTRAWPVKEVEAGSNPAPLARWEAS